MNTALELFDRKVKRTFSELYEKIFGFLDFSCLFQTLTVSTEFYNLINQHFKHFLVSQGLITATDKQVTGDHYLKLFKMFYAREVLKGDLNSVTDSYNELKLERNPRCSTYGIRDFILDTKFVVFHLFNNDMIFMRYEEYFDPKFDMQSINRKNIRKDVKKIYTKSKNLCYLTISGQFHVIFYNSNLPSNELCEGILEFTIDHPLNDFAVSYNHAIPILQVPENKQNSVNNLDKLDDGEEHKENKPIKKKIYQDIRYFGLHDLTPEDFNVPIRLKKVDGLDDQEIICFCVGNMAAYFLVNQYQTYECDFSLMNNEKYLLLPFEPLKNKAIKNLWCGYNFHFALEQEELDSIDNWSQQEILQWVRLMKFNEYHNIIKYENISGKDLLQADQAFLINRLGMIREEVQTRFLNEVEKISKKTVKKPKLYGWGNNTFGQLGINTGNLVVNNPTEVPLPVLEKDEQIADIECGWKASAILTNQGNIWITEIPVKKAPKEHEDQAKVNHDKKKKNQQSEANAKEKEVDKTGDSKWTDLTQICTTQRDGRQYKIIKISLTKDKFAALGANLGLKKKTKNHSSENTMSFSKFKGADQIFNRLLWDKSLHMEDFTIGYEDRFLGVLEIPFDVFAKKTDIPSHRIKFFKRKGEVVWDRHFKLNKL